MPVLQNSTGLNRLRGPVLASALGDCSQTDLCWNLGSESSNIRQPPPSTALVSVVLVPHSDPHGSLESSVHPSPRFLVQQIMAHTSAFLQRTACELVELPGGSQKYGIPNLWLQDEPDTPWNIHCNILVVSG